MTNPVKIIQISDPHLVPRGGKVHGGDPFAKLAAAIADVNAHHGDAALVVVSGDLADAGERGAYDVLREALARLSPPFRLMAGNHDERALIREIFPETAASDGGFLQDAIDLPGLRIILLDTLDPGHVAGRLDAVRLRWLEEALAGAQGRPVHLFMHHPPFPLHMAEFDSLPLAGADALRDLVTRHGRVRHIHAGHVHRFVAGSWHDIPVSVTRSTSHQTALRSGMGWTLGPERPGYAVILVEAAGTIVHFHEIEA